MSAQLGIMLYGKNGEERNVFSEVKYKLLAEKLVENNIPVETINYNDSDSEKLFTHLLKYKVILVWINPMEKDMNRQTLDNFLRKITREGVFVSAHPDTILKIGTKDILYKTRNISWSNNINIYNSYNEFEAGFIGSLEKYGSRILKPYRGNGGIGITKITIDKTGKDKISIQYAERGIAEEKMNISEFLNLYKNFFNSGNCLIDQEWCSRITNGMVRCYLTFNKVVGFGYQEINALYPANSKDDFTKKQPSKRYYYTEACGLFRDLRIKMENDWVPQLTQMFNLKSDELPVIWDADFFIDDSSGTDKKYILCEINTSSVSPFPESAIMPIIEAAKMKIE